MDFFLASNSLSLFAFAIMATPAFHFPSHIVAYNKETKEIGGVL